MVALVEVEEGVAVVPRALEELGEALLAVGVLHRGPVAFGALGPPCRRFNLPEEVVFLADDLEAHRLERFLGVTARVDPLGQQPSGVFCDGSLGVFLDGQVGTRRPTAQIGPIIVLADVHFRVARLVGHLSTPVFNVHMDCT